MPRRKTQSWQTALEAFLRLSPRQQLILAGGVLAIALCIGIVSWALHRPKARSPQPHQQVRLPEPSPPPTSPAPPLPTARPTPTVHLLLGNPSNATADASKKDNFLMMKAFYALSYNNDNATANWVSWRVTIDDLGDAPRKRSFDADLELPAGFIRIEHRDYTNSGFDRGHLCPNGDRGASQQSAYSTFVMTNIIPQAPKVNQGAWADLETYCRNLVMQGNRVYIIAGPHGVGGTGTKGAATSIAGGKVKVPAECWKVMVVVPRAGGEDDLAKIDADTRVMNVLMPNDEQKILVDWKKYRTTTAAIEKATGYKFFTTLKPDLADKLKYKSDVP